MNLKKNGKVFTSKSVGIRPSSFEKRIYRAAVWQRLRNTGVVNAGSLPRKFNRFVSAAVQHSGAVWWMPISGPGFGIVAGFSYDDDGKFRLTFACWRKTSRLCWLVSRNPQLSILDIIKVWDGYRIWRWKWFQVVGVPKTLFLCYTKIIETAAI